MELGDWYKGLADQAAVPASKGAMLRHAQAYYQRFLVLHPATDLGRSVATLALKRIEDALAKLVSGPVPKSSAAALTLDFGKGVTMKLVLIRPGRFMMGSPDSEQGGDSRESPQHEVVITKPFYIGVTEVTQAQYEAVMGRNPSKFKGPTNPVDSVIWDEAVEFCRKLSEKTGETIRLPTEAEWEYACRAGRQTRFSFGDSDSALGDYAWYGGNSGDTEGVQYSTHPVGQKKPNAWGLYDMHGNVYEWCADRYGPYSSGSSTDPQGAGSGGTRVVRGGSWRDGETDTLRCAHRYGHPPSFRRNNYGFRCAMTP
jgi:formylglycine-generating enzyme required for sulfatase activity